MRVLNSDKKWDSIRDKITESNCDIICLQETKKSDFDLCFIKKFCPPRFDKFEFLPSIGASGGVITIWKSHLFQGTLAFRNEYGISVNFTCQLSGLEWILTNIYGPCTHPGKLQFTNWLANIQMPDNYPWLLVGDFNLMRRPKNRNRPGGDVNDMFLFNEALSSLGVVELPLLGKKFIWSNKQNPPLLERLDWFFTSAEWTLLFPETTVSTLSMETSDHVPCLITATTNVPKGGIFRFENYLMEHDDFLGVVQHGWSLPTPHFDKAKVITA